MSGEDARFLDASALALRAYHADLESAINDLASEGTDGASTLTAQCLRTVDALNNTHALYKEVWR